MLLNLIFLELVTTRIEDIKYKRCEFKIEKFDEGNCGFFAYTLPSNVGIAQCAG